MDVHEKLRAALDSVGRLTQERDAARAEIERMRAELAAAESTIVALEDPELRAALTTPTAGDFGPVPAAETRSYDPACDWSPTGTHQRGTGRARGECDHCDAPMPATETGSRSGEVPSVEDLNRQIKTLVDQYNKRHCEETGCTCRTILAGMTAHGCPKHDAHDDW